MTTIFDSLPIVDLLPLQGEHPTEQTLRDISTKLHDVFTTTGVAYLINPPLSFSHDDVFGLASRFFQLDEAEKMRLAKKTFVESNDNTYRGYFPAQSGQKDNLKEGFEIGPWSTVPIFTRSQAERGGFDLSEPNVWPDESRYPGGRASLEKLHTELQTLSCTLLSLLAVSLGKSADFFASYLPGSVSTLRLLHYPPQDLREKASSDNADDPEAGLCCTPHTDSGIMTLLHQDQTGGLEVLNKAGVWVPAPYVPGSIVVNIGDLLSRVSGGRFVATMHRVRASAPSTSEERDGADRGLSGPPRMGRLSVPFFFEPGEACMVESIDGGESVVYGDHVRRKMGTWVEFQDPKTAQQPLPAGIAVATIA